VDLEYIVEYFAALANLEVEMTQEQQLALVRAMFIKAEIDASGNLTLTCRIPLAVNEFQSRRHLQGLMGGSPERRR